MNNKRILIVEDDAFIVEALSMLLEEQGFEVISSFDGEIFNYPFIEYPHLILLDIRLSGEDRRDLCKWIKEHQDMKHIPVILISGNREIEKIHQECGANDFIVKPFELDHLLSKINMFMAN